MQQKDKNKYMNVERKDFASPKGKNSSNKGKLSTTSKPSIAVSEESRTIAFAVYYQ